MKGLSLPVFYLEALKNQRTLNQMTGRCLPLRCDANMKAGADRDMCLDGMPDLAGLTNP